MDYGTRIADATNTKNASYGSYNEFAGQANQAYDKYNQQFDQRQGYGDIYDAARQKYMNTDEINNARSAYQNSRDAVNLINTTINKLPESIRQQYGGTGLTEAQRARAMAYQQDKLANTYNYANQSYQDSSRNYQDLVNRAMSDVQNEAGMKYKSQEDALSALQSNWGTLLGQRNTAYNQYQQDLAALAGVNSERDKAEQIREQMALERWIEQQANDRAQKQLNLQSYLANMEAEQNKAALSLQSQLADKQSRAGYNAYVRKANAAADDQFEKDNNIWNWIGAAINPFDKYTTANQYSRDILNKSNKARNVMTYDQWAGNV